MFGSTSICCIESIDVVVFSYRPWYCFHKISVWVSWVSGAQKCLQQWNSVCRRLRTKQISSLMWLAFKIIYCYKYKWNIMLLHAWMIHIRRKKQHTHTHTPVSDTVNCRFVHTKYKHWIKMSQQVFGFIQIMLNEWMWLIASTYCDVLYSFHLLKLEMKNKFGRPRSIHSIWQERNMVVIFINLFTIQRGNLLLKFNFIELFKLHSLNYL